MREDIPIERAIPQAIEAEQYVLGALLLQPSAYDHIDWLKPEAFFRQSHKVIYGAIQALIESGRGVDALLVAERLAGADELDTAGGRLYLAELVTSTPGIALIRRHAETIREKARLRDLIGSANQVLMDCYAASADPAAIANDAETAFLSVLENPKGGEEVGFDRAVMEAIEQRDSPSTIISTGYANIDRLLKGGGMKAGQLIVVAGRPSMGKSALAWNIAEHVAKTKHVAGFTLEMERSEVADRSIEYHSSLTDRDTAARYLMDLRMTLDDKPAVTLAHIRLRARRLKRKHGLGLIVVDYLQLMESKGQTREQEISTLSRGLKAIAKEVQCPVIAVAQLNRGVEQRQDKRPMLSDLRESGAIEQDADVVAMLYREDYYNPQTLAPGIAEVIVRKQRGGAVGTAFMRFTPETTRFHDYAGPAPIYTEASEPRVSGRVKAVDFKQRSSGD